jgi:LysR family nod box-dependent transcriptional activator
MASIARGEVDLVISTEHDPRAEGVAGLHCQPLYVDRWMCAVDANHPKVGDTITRELFTSLPHLEWGMGTPPIPNRGETAYRRLGLEARVPLTIESFALTPLLLAGTDRLTMRSVCAACVCTDTYGASLASASANGWNRRGKA